MTVTVFFSCVLPLPDGIFGLLKLPKHALVIGSGLRVNPFGLVRLLHLLQELLFVEPAVYGRGTHLLGHRVPLTRFLHKLFHKLGLLLLKPLQVTSAILTPRCQPVKLFAPFL